MIAHNITWSLTIYWFEHCLCVFRHYIKYNYREPLSYLKRGNELDGAHESNFLRRSEVRLKDNLNSRIHEKGHDVMITAYQTTHQTEPGIGEA